MNSFQLTTVRYLLDGFDNSAERLGVVHGEVGQHFAVETDVLLGQTAHELGIGETILADGGVDTLYPEGTEFTLLGFAVTISVGKSFLVGVLCNCPDILAGQEVAASLAENLLAACP